MATPKTAFTAWQTYRRVLPLLRDSRVPGALKIGTGALALLIISPLDIFGDIPVLGMLDDAVLLTLLAMGFVALAARFIAQPVMRNVTPTESASPADPAVLQLPRARPVRKT